MAVPWPGAAGLRLASLGLLMRLGHLPPCLALISPGGLSPMWAVGAGLSAHVPAFSTVAVHPPRRLD